MSAAAEDEIRRLFEDYRATFNSDDIEGCLRYFAIPCILISFGRVLHVDSREKFIAHWGGTHRKMREGAITDGRIAGLKVFPLDDDTAAAAVIFHRLDAKGAIVSQQAGAYHLFRGEEGWKVYSFIMHRSEAWLGGRIGLEAN
jgi:ketosteroid isomerase-like protein